MHPHDHERRSAAISRHLSDLKGRMRLRPRLRGAGLPVEGPRPHASHQALWGAVAGRSGVRCRRGPKRPGNRRRPVIDGKGKRGQEATPGEASTAARMPLLPSLGRCRRLQASAPHFPLLEVLELRLDFPGSAATADCHDVPAKGVAQPKGPTTASGNDSHARVPLAGFRRDTRRRAGSLI